MTALNVHATCVVIGRRGVLLLGRSGAGKSDLALRLIGRGGSLVADDRCDLFVRNGALHARAPLAIAGKMEVRGVGIVRVPARQSARLVLAVDLKKTYPRLPDVEYYSPLLGARPLPRITLNPFETSAPDKIFLAIRHIEQGDVPPSVKRRRQ